MAFPPQFLDEIRARVPIVGVVGRRVQLRKRGREHEGLCPFHKEKTPSFTVSEEKGFYHCFGCGAHGDVIGFVMESEGLSFPETIERLAGEAGLEVPRATPQDREAEERRNGLMEALEAAAGWYQSQLESGVGDSARRYLEGREVSAETASVFRLGFAPNHRGALRKALNAKGFRDDLLIAAGLMKAPEGGGEPRDYFFDRVIFPITDRKNRVLAFGGRALGESKAKYINSPESHVYHKGRLLYNLPRARQAAHDTGELLVVEGYMDVIALYGHGFQAAVAPLGTAITVDQVGELWRLAGEPVLCLDGDAAGYRAARRAAETALPLLTPGRSLRFALLPAGEDPDSLVAGQGAAALRAVVERALGLDELLWQVETGGRSLTTPERRADLWKALETLVKLIKDPAIQGGYREVMEQRFEKTLGFNPRGGRARGWSSRGWQGKGRHQGRGSGLADIAGPGIRQDPKRLRRHREEVLLAAFVNHPLVLIDYAESLAKVPFANKDLADLAMGIIDTLAGTPDLDSEQLKCHLSEQGYANILAGLLSPRVYVHGGFARPETAAEEVLASWQHFLGLQREEALRLEAEQASRRLAEELTDEGVAQLQARQRAIEGDESKRVEFDWLDGGKSN